MFLAINHTNRWTPRFDGSCILINSAKRNVNHGKLNISRRPNGLSANFLQDQWINISEKNNRNTDSEGKTSETYHR